MNKISNDSIVDLFMQIGKLNATEVSKRLGISKPTCLRIFKELKTIKIGEARNSRYVLPRDLEGLGNNWTIYQIGEDTLLSEIAKLHYTSAGFYLQTTQAYPSLFSNEFKDCIFDSLPWFLYDERPRGFIGRNIVYKLNGTYNIPKDIKNWSDAQILNYMLNFSKDTPSAFIVGEKAKTAFLQREYLCLREEDREREYPILAENAIRLGVPISSADGEQPKFCLRKKSENATRDVIVKFSGKLDNPSSVRISDLLIAEHIALNILAENGFTSAKSEILFFGNRTFLESERIDRSPNGGQKAFSSLSAIDAAFLGSGGENWVVAMENAPEYFSIIDIETVKIVYDFGSAIGNTDMHFGNLSFYIDRDLPFRLAPIYDMLPMIYAPRSDDSLKNDKLNVRASTEIVSRLAKSFWIELSKHPKLSENFRAIAQANSNIRTF